jgi:hypothetical protein
MNPLVINGQELRGEMLVMREARIPSRWRIRMAKPTGAAVYDPDCARSGPQGDDSPAPGRFRSGRNDDAADPYDAEDDFGLQDATLVYTGTGARPAYSPA